MFATLLKKRITTFFVIAFLILSLLATYFTPKIDASPITLNSISPSSGYVGAFVRVNGVIDTVNGTYKIFFDEELVVNGTASSQRIVNATFFIPHRYGGSHAVTLHDVNASTTSAPMYFTINTKYQINAIIPPKQTQLMEGQSTTIKINITGGENKLYRANVTVTLPKSISKVHYNGSLQLENTGRTGEYVANSTYPNDFGPNAHTNYNGTYNIASNITSETGAFTVGLTNATVYHRFGTVAIQGAGYTQPDESVQISIKNSTGKAVFSKNVTAIEGVVNANWTIPWNAPYGTYNVTVASLTSNGTVKPICDNQTFTIIKATFPCQIRVRNLDNENVSGVTVEAYIGTQKVSTLAPIISDNAGLAKFSLETYKYSFKAFLKGVQVGDISALNITGNITRTLVCQIANIKLFIKDEAGNPLPFIAMDLKYNYTRADGIKVSDIIPLETGNAGIVNFQNTFTKINYLIEAKRYGHIFNTTSIGNLTASQSINITCPTCTLFINVVDSKEHPLSNVSVNVTEWSSGFLVENKTDYQGSVSLSLTFGRYKLKVYNYSAEINRLVALNETTVDLTEKELFKPIYCRIVNLSPSVLVADYFGQPIPNAEVKVERFSEIEQEWVEIMPHQRTDSNGVASLPKIGGDYSISIYVLGQLSSIKSFYINEGSILVFKIDKYITFGGLVLETSQLVTCIALGLLIISLGIVLTYKKIWQKVTKK